MKNSQSEKSRDENPEVKRDTDRSMGRQIHHHILSNNYSLRF